MKKGMTRLGLLYLRKYEIENYRNTDQYRGLSKCRKMLLGIDLLATNAAIRVVEATGG